jgi:hypothetical protein
VGENIKTIDWGGNSATDPRFLNLVEEWIDGDAVMHQRTRNIVSVGICLLMLSISFLCKEINADASSPYDGLMDIGIRTIKPELPEIGSTKKLQTGSATPCLPSYSEPQFVLRVRDAGSYEPELDTGDFNGDGLDDVVIRRAQCDTTNTYVLDVLLNDGNGSLILGTSGIFSGTVPFVQCPRRVLVADFNGDERPDFFVQDQGMDAEPFPGYQNTLVLSLPGSKLVDATNNLPQLNDFTHSGTAGDIDGDDDNDLYIGNIWGQNFIDPYILINDGNGQFTIAENSLHPALSLGQNGYTASEFVDVNNDNFPDLILADAGDDISHAYPTQSIILINDGTGKFTAPPIELPPKPFAPSNIGLDIQPADLDHDGYQDLFIVYTKGIPWYEGRYVQILMNNKDSTFRDETGMRLPQVDNNDPFFYRLQLMDLNRDQEIDLIARPWDDSAPNPHLFLNNGNGYFSRKLLDFKLPYIYYAFLDLDGDDGHDLVYASYAPPEDIYIIRQLGCPVFLPFICANYSSGN